MASSPVEGVILERKQHSAEKNAAKLRQVGVLAAQIRKIPESIRSIEVTGATYYCCLSKYGSLKGD